eukprot:4569837-Pleurochrysis_carterae.AAC.1
MLSERGGVLAGSDALGRRPDSISRVVRLSRAGNESSSRSTETRARYSGVGGGDGGAAGEGDERDGSDGEVTSEAGLRSGNGGGDGGGGDGGKGDGTGAGGGAGDGHEEGGDVGRNLAGDQTAGADVDHHRSRGGDAGGSTERARAKRSRSRTDRVSEKRSSEIAAGLDVDVIFMMLDSISSRRFEAGMPITHALLKSWAAPQETSRGGEGSGSRENGRGSGGATVGGVKGSTRTSSGSFSTSHS